jgi:hypothetical protein
MAGETTTDGQGARAMSRRFWVGAAVLVALATVVLFGRALFLGQLFAERDLRAYYYPAKWLLSPLTKAAGGVPLWNPLFASGQPFAANPEHAIFHPLTTLFFLLPYHWAFRLQVILPPILAVPCMVWFLRVLGRGRAAALAGGLGWGFGGILLSGLNLLPIPLSAFSLPLTLAFAVRTFRAATVGHVVGLAFSLALQCLGGEPTTLLQLVPLLMATLLAEKKPALLRRSRFVGLGFVLGLAIAAAVIVPGLHHASRTIRAAGFTDAMANEWSMPAVRFFELLAPHVLGHVDRGDLSRYWGAGFYGSKTFAFYYSLYPGLLLSLLALRAWFARPRRFWPWAVVAGLGFLIALGDRFFLWPLMRHAPGMSGIRYPEKASLLFVFPVLVLGSYGFDWLLGLRSFRRFLWKGLGLLAVAGAGLALLVRMFSKTGAAFSVADALRDSLRLSIVALGLAVALWLSRRWRRASRGLLLCALLCIDLVEAGRELLPTVPATSLANPPIFLAPLLQSRQDELLFHMAEWNTQFADSAGLAKPPIPARWGIPTTLERDFDFTQLRWTYESTQTWMLTAKERQDLIGPLLQRRGVTRVLQFAPGLTWQGNRLVRPDGGPTVELLSAREAKPFVFPASRVEVVQGPAGWQAKVRELGEEVAHTACVEDSELPAFANPPGKAVVRAQRHTPEHITIDVEAEGPNPAFIAINQTWDSSWRVRVDDQEARLLRTDLDLSGLVVPSGVHRIVLEYRDDWVLAGMLLSGLAAAGALVVLLLAQRRQRRRLPLSP